MRQKKQCLIDEENKMNNEFVREFFILSLFIKVFKIIINHENKICLFILFLSIRVVFIVALLQFYVVNSIENQAFLH